MKEHNISKDGKLAAIIAHLTFIGPIIAWFINQEERDSFGSFYIKQSFGLVCLYFLLGSLVAMIPNMYAFIGFNLFLFILWIYSFSGAISNQYKLLPVIGNFIQKALTSKKK
ncbi:Uncharacterized membrane protein [Paenimyroides aquimaris]|uniref:Uncharacterized membrane protein n=1 Tax=Paenimyroides marinum TaxID=1159016 RepID=A0A1H6KVH4_9FLAO|nr:hypothetical protein [Paenimyroides aquimaris]SEH76932.1 Uncharacterized membrane protein [Paenimyroides aquimaris]